MALKVQRVYSWAFFLVTWGDLRIISIILREFSRYRTCQFSIETSESETSEQFETLEAFEVFETFETLETLETGREECRLEELGGSTCTSEAKVTPPLGCLESHSFCWLTRTPIPLKQRPIASKQGAIKLSMAILQRFLTQRSSISSPLRHGTQHQAVQNATQAK